MGSWLQSIPLGRTHQGQSTYYISSQLQPHAASPTLLLVFAHPFQIQLLIETPLKEQLKPKTYFNEPNEPTNASFILQREINKKKKQILRKTLHSQIHSSTLIIEVTTVKLDQLICRI